jgi:hypothetical protein
LRFREKSLRARSAERNLPSARPGPTSTARWPNSIPQANGSTSTRSPISSTSAKTRGAQSSTSSATSSAIWWGPWAHVVPDWLKTFVGLEGLAEREFVFEPLIIPSLLQTEMLFTRAEMDAWVRGVKAGEFDDLT